MKLALFSLLAGLASVSAHAETFRCVFTEPFVTVSYSTTTRALVLHNDGDQSSNTIKGVEFAIVAKDAFVLKKGGAILAHINHNNEGSDGMSDRLFPFEMITTLIPGPAGGAYGGCESSLLDL